MRLMNAVGKSKLAPPNGRSTALACSKPELLLGFCLSGVLDEPLGDVDPGHEGATLRKQAGIVPFLASDIEARERPSTLGSISKKAGVFRPSR